MAATLRLELDKGVIVEKTIEQLTKLLNLMEGIGSVYNEGMESRRVIVLANDSYTS